MGTTYFYDADHFHSPQLTCLSPSYDEVYNYLAKIRRIQVVNIDDRCPNLGDAHGVCAAITAATFANEGNYQGFVNDPSRTPFFLVEYEVPIDRHIAGISKKDAKNAMIPQIILDIINDEAVHFRTELNQANYTLKELLYYLNGLDATKMKIQADSRALVHVCDMIEDFVHKDGYEVTKGIYKRHPILFCDEHEYRSYVTNELRSRELDEMYHNRIDDPYS